MTGPRRPATEWIRLTGIELTRIRLRQGPERFRAGPSRRPVVPRPATEGTRRRDCRRRRYRRFRRVRVPATGLRTCGCLRARICRDCLRGRWSIREPATFGRRLGNHGTRRYCDRSAVAAVDSGSTDVCRAQSGVPLRAPRARTIVAAGLRRPNGRRRLGSAHAQQGHCQHRCQEISSVHLTPPPQLGAAAPLAHKSQSKCNAGARGGIFESSAQGRAAPRNHRHARVRMS
jgi:hypothetical protein